jgi:LA2681-like HEPN
MWCIGSADSGEFSGRTPTTMTDEERLHKNTVCDRLMREGLDGWQDEENVARAALLTDLALELERTDSLACVLGWYEVLEEKGISGELAIFLDYNRANAIAGERHGTEWKWEQPTLARELYYLRRAVSRPEFSRTSPVFRCKCLNNLGRRLSVAGRATEALEYWRRTLEVRPDFGMALCNRARTLAAYAAAQEDTGQRAVILSVAHTEASAALAPGALYTDVRDERTRGKAKELKEWIESVLDVRGIAAADPLACQDISTTEEERDYRLWCLVNCLYLNPLNDLGPYTVANCDSKCLEAHVVSVDAPYKFVSFFDQMKQEYVSARWSLYEGLIAKAPHFSDRDVFLEATEPRPSLCLAVEKIKTSFRVSYSLFDKIGFFMNSYMELGIPQRQVTFRTLWRSGDNRPIRSQFDLRDNWGFCALYWVAKDSSRGRTTR